MNSGGKHKVTMSTDANMNNNYGGQNQQLNSMGSNHNKNISMNGLPYDKVKGLTPISNKGKSGGIQQN